MGSIPLPLFDVQRVQAVGMMVLQCDAVALPGADVRRDIAEVIKANEAAYKTADEAPHFQQDVSVGGRGALIAAVNLKAQRLVEE